MTEEEAIRAGYDIKVIWPDNGVQYEHHERLKGLTQKGYDGALIRPVVLIYIGELPTNYNHAKVNLLARLARADVCIPARTLRI